MAKYKILVIAHCLKNNVVAKCGDVVEESQLTSPADELVESGFIEEVKLSNKEKAAAEAKAKADAESQKKAEAKAEKDSEAKS